MKKRDWVQSKRFPNLGSLTVERVTTDGEKDTREVLVKNDFEVNSIDMHTGPHPEMWISIRSDGNDGLIIYEFDSFGRQKIVKHLRVDDLNAYECLNMELIDKGIDEYKRRLKDNDQKEDCIDRENLERLYGTLEHEGGEIKYINHQGDEGYIKIDENNMIIVK